MAAMFLTAGMSFCMCVYCLCRNQQAQLVASLNVVLGNKPNLTLTIEGLKPVSETKTQVVIYVQEKSVTGNINNNYKGRKINETNDYTSLVVEPGGSTCYHYTCPEPTTLTLLDIVHTKAVQYVTAEVVLHLYLSF
jgi:hypothetical protein